ncbi:MAG: UvrD-helicase domain-containing protein [Candidatus Nanohaloarchaea archaeon]
MNPNKQQKKIIESTEGVHVVDAGAGTGKTFTIVRRYVQILQKGVEPFQIFLATFTRNAADEMSERIAQNSEKTASEIFDAPISTFHSHCQKIIERNGFNAPQLLGFDKNISNNTRILESNIRERQKFEQFYNRFKAEEQKYQDFYRVVDDASQLLHLIKSLASKGIIPEEDGWFNNSEKYLEGDFEEFKKKFKEANKPRDSGNGSKKQSELRDRLYSYKWKNFTEEAPEPEDIRGDYGTKQVRKDFMRKAFKEDREQLKQFIHDLYRGYMRYCLSENYLNFSFLMVFAYVLLHEDKQVREQEKFRYLMIDEFQDTNQLQFKTALLLAEKPNIFAVGDWKQSIYSFQYADIQNIRSFEKRIKQFHGQLKRQADLKYSLKEVNRESLTINYRSLQKILDTAEKAFELPANTHEHVDRPDTTSLEADREGEAEVARLESEDEINLVLDKIKQLAEQGYEAKDVAVLTRTRSFGIELQREAKKQDIPVSYEGGVELFKTNPAIMLLAWLRIVYNNSVRGWAVVLEEADYLLDEVKEMTEQENYPEDMESFRDELRAMDSLTAVARQVFERYGYRNGFTEKIIEVLDSTFSNSFMNLSEMIRFIEENIEEGEIYEVDTSRSRNTVKIQTIHAAKGLEYPVVILSDINKSKFPNTQNRTNPISYDETIGVRKNKEYLEDHAFVYDSWKSEILHKTLSGEYDEERRLMYVAMTRAEDKLFFTADEERKSTFFTELDVEKQEIEQVPAVEFREEKPEPFEIDV